MLKAAANTLANISAGLIKLLFKMFIYEWNKNILDFKYHETFLKEPEITILLKILIF